MKSAGIVRKVDQLGRVVLPIELRKQYSIALKDPIEILVERNMIVFRKYIPKCEFCGDSESIQVKRGKNICKSCLDNLLKL